MQDDAAARSWFGTGESWSRVVQQDDSREFARIWQGFMLARMTLGLVLLVLHVGLYAMSVAPNHWPTVISAAYFISTLARDLYRNPQLLGKTFNLLWLRVVGLDVLAIATLQLVQGSGINYTPIYALPVLLASVLGPLQLALGTAAGVTVLMLVNSVDGHGSGYAEAAPFLVQAALGGVGYFIMALLANQLATRLISASQVSLRNQVAAHIQRQVNELVIESLPNGVLIVDSDGVALAANPSARALLSPRADARYAIRTLRDLDVWQPLLDLAVSTIGQRQAQEREVTLRHAGQGPQRIRVNTQLVEAQELGGENLCVLFMQDQRELEARLRTDKLASMGRMSTAVAHDIRNPLAAITQANALLEEDLKDPHHQQLSRVVTQNAQRLAKIVDDILNATRVHPDHADRNANAIALDGTVQRICRDWAQQFANPVPMAMDVGAGATSVAFDTEHLHRLIVNLLDNARRYASGRPDSIQVFSHVSPGSTATLGIWSDGAPMEQSVERHLFEPFFSSESRSNGLGLYICRELCESHGATISFQRTSRAMLGGVCEGNAFVVEMRAVAVNS